RKLSVAHLVSHRALRFAHEPCRRAVMRELARERRERVDRGGLEVGDAREVRAHSVPAKRAAALQAHGSTADADASMRAYNFGVQCRDVAIGADLEQVARVLDRVAECRDALGDHLVATGRLTDTPLVSVAA